MNFQALVLKALIIVAPPGNTRFSVTVEKTTSDLRPQTSEERPQTADLRIGSRESEVVTRWSSFYGSYVHQETRDEGAERYVRIVDAEIEAAETELCRDSEGAMIANCSPNPKSKAWTVRDLLARASGLMIAESGVREDVEVGRGQSAISSQHSARKFWLTADGRKVIADDAGGQGRGPAGEVCLMQIHPRSISAFAPDGDGSPASLLGSDHEHLVRCFRTGMRMLIQARAYCDWTMSKYAKQYPSYQYDTYFGMFSMYGSGQSCMSNNAGKTSYRVALANRVSHQLSAVSRRPENRTTSDSRPPTAEKPKRAPGSRLQEGK